MQWPALHTWWLGRGKGLESYPGVQMVVPVVEEEAWLPVIAVLPIVATARAPYSRDCTASR